MGSNNSKSNSKFDEHTKPQHNNTLVYEETNYPSTIDEATDFLIKSNFNEKEVGRYLLSLASEKDGIEKAIAFASIIVKARRARLNMK